MNIPKTIHQIWFQGRDAIPDKHRQFVERWKLLNPDHNHVIWDSEAIEELLVQSPRWKHVYDGFPLMIQKIDFSKYVILYLYGGTYVDMDMCPLQPLNVITDAHPDATYVAAPHNAPTSTLLFNKMLGLRGKRIINNAAIMCTAQNPVTLHVIEECIKNQKTWKASLGKEVHTLLTTGPIVYTNALLSIKKKHPLVVLCPYIFEPCSVLDISTLVAHDGEYDIDHLLELQRRHPERCQGMDKAVAVHFLDLTWFRNGRNNWKFRMYRRNQRRKWTWM